MATPNFKNRTLYHCDNLPVLRGMNSETVHLIATDPPFNKSRDFHATPDSLARGARFQDRWSWRDDIHDDWLLDIQRDHADVWAVINTTKHVYGDDLGAFLCFMAVRLLEMHRVLREDGSLYLHCDSTASHYLKALLDAIFGAGQFKNQIVWRRNESAAKGSQHAPSSWGNNADCLLFYAKSDAVNFDPRIIRDFDDDELKRRYPKVDENGERYHTKMTAWRSPSMGARPNLCYPYKGIDPPYPSGWRLSRKRMQEEYDKGNIVVRTDGKLERRSYAHDYRGVSPGNLWTETELLLGAQSSERVGYPTQKPLALYERIIKASSNEGDIVLDPFAGCATTCVAAERLERQWVGIDIWDKAHETVLSRLESEGLAIPRGGGGEVWKAHVVCSPLAMSTTRPSRPNAPTKASQPWWNFAHRLDVWDGDSRLRVNSMAGYFSTLVRSARVAVETTASTRVCSKWTTSDQSRTADRTHTITSRYCVRPATVPSWTE